LRRKNRAARFSIPPKKAVRTRTISSCVLNLERAAV